MGSAVRLIQRGVEAIADGGIRHEFLTRCECPVIRIELSFEHPQAIEFREKKASRIARRAHRVIRMLLLEGQKDLMSASKVEVVEQTEPVIQRGRTPDSIDCRHRPTQETE